MTQRIEVNYRHYLIKDGGTVVGKFDDANMADIEIPDDLTYQPIRIPDDLPDRSKALEKLTDTPVEWDDRLR